MTQKAINYAEVLCELNIDAAELSDMEAVVRENPELQEALTCPVVSREKKSEVIDKIFDGSKTTVKFLKVLCNNSDFDQFFEICREYRVLIKKKADVLLATLYYVTPPTETQKKGIEDFLKKEYKTSDVELTSEKKDSLIGGFIIKVGNKEYDWSLAGRCKRLTQRLVTR